MKPGEIGGPLKADQNVVVFQLKEKKEFNPTEFAKDKTGIRDQLLSTKQNTFLQGYRAMLRKKYEKEIWINEAAVNPEANVTTIQLLRLSPAPFQWNGKVCFRFIL